MSTINEQQYKWYGENRQRRALKAQAGDMSVLNGVSSMMPVPGAGAAHVVFQRDSGMSARNGASYSTMEYSQV